MLRFTFFAISMSVLLTSPSFARMSATEQAMRQLDCQNGDKQACDSILFISPFVDVSAQMDAEALMRREHDLVKSCEEGAARACGDLGASLMTTKPVDNPDTYTYLAKGCDFGDGWSCSKLSEFGFSLSYAAGPNFKTYYDAQARKCQEGDIAACATQGRLNAQLKTTVPDKAIWHDKVKEACTAGNSRACVNMSYIYSEDGLDEYQQLDPALGELRRSRNRSSVRYARKACRWGNPVGCWNLGLSYDYGEGVREDWKTAQHYYVLACNGGYADACADINDETYWKVRDPLDELVQACDTGDFTACLYANQRKHEPILSGPREGEDGERMASYRAGLDEICKAGSSAGCGFAASIARTYDETDLAERYAVAGCQTGTAAACATLGNVWKLDRGGEEGYRKSLPFLNLACESQNWVACNNLGDSYEHGFGVDIDLVQAERLFTLACTNRKGIGCNNLGQLLEETDPDRAKAANADACRLNKRYCD